MKRFVEGECRDQSVLFPERLDDWIAEDNPVRAVDAFVDELDFSALGFDSAEPAETATDGVESARPRGSGPLPPFLTDYIPEGC
jgi:transposase